MVGGKLMAVSQRFRRNHHGRRRHRLLVGFEAAHAPLGLAVEPALRDENREQAEDDGKPDHHDGAGTHG
jgi:hypothetical protein